MSFAPSSTLVSFVTYFTIVGQQFLSYQNTVLVMGWGTVLETHPGAETFLNLPFAGRPARWKRAPDESTPMRSIVGEANAVAAAILRGLPSLCMTPLIANHSHLLERHLINHLAGKVLMMFDLAFHHTVLWTGLEHAYVVE